MAITAPTLPTGAPRVEDLVRLTGIEILRDYGPEVYRLMSDLQGSGIVPYSRTDYDVAVTREMRLQIIAKEGDCRCGKIDCWKEEMGLERDAAGAGRAGR